MEKKIFEDFEEYKLPSAIIFCDIDGIWADLTHRLPYAKKKEYDKFYGACMADDSKMMLAPVATCAFVSGMYNMYNDCRFMLLTGRPKRTRTLTRMWLKDNYPNFFAKLRNDDILCRPDEDWGPAPKVKAKLAADYLSSDKCQGMYELGNADIFFIDDDPAVISYIHNFFLDSFPSSQRDKLEGCIHPILMDAGRLASSYEPNKSHEEQFSQ